MTGLGLGLGQFSYQQWAGRRALPQILGRRCSVAQLVAEILISSGVPDAPFSLCHVTVREVPGNNQIFGHGFQSEKSRLTFTFTLQLEESETIPFRT